MECLELRIPPLPQWLTVGHAFWHIGEQHINRSFDVYDVLFVKQGVIFMAEEGKQYEIREGNMLVLEPNRRHWGYRATDEETELYWVHFKHQSPIRTLSSEDIHWSYLLKQGTDQDETPGEQYMYIPKFIRMDLTPLLPIMNRMLELHASFSVGCALEQHMLLAQLLTMLQSKLHAKQTSRSASLSDQVIRFLLQTETEPFSAKRLEEELHFGFDYLSRCLKKHTGMTPLQYTQHIRMSKAKSLLEHTNLSVREIAEQVGIPDTNYFVRTFRKQAGMPPGAYRSIKQEKSG